MIEDLKLWEKKIKYADEVYDSLYKFFQAQPESPVFKALYQSIEAYTDSLEWALTKNPRSDWLSWYWLENDMGKKGLEANPGTWDEDRPIKTLKDLEELLKATEEEKHMVVVHVQGGTVQQVLSSYEEDEVVTTIIDFDSGDLDSKEELLKTAEKNLNPVW